MKAKRLLLVSILLLGIGFAVVTTTLYLNGNVKIATNDANFDVRFTDATLDGTNISSTAISGEGKTITFQTKDLSTVGDKSILDFEVTNNSEMYDADVRIECSATGEKNDYYQITSEVATPIVAKTKGTGKVEVALIKATVEDIQETFTCTLRGNAKERTTKAEKPRYAPKYFAVGAQAPTTSSTTDYNTLGRNTFMGLDADGSQLSVCIIKNGYLECFKTGSSNVAAEQAHLREVFGKTKCEVSGASVTCNDLDYGCFVRDDGAVDCNDHQGDSCAVGGDGWIGCN